VNFCESIATYKDSPKGEVRGETINVGSFPTNEWGLYDMHGNDWEWCEDDWHESYKGAPYDGSAWIDSDNRSQSRKLLRGGSWFNAPQYCRSADRADDMRVSRNYFIGFRMCCVPPRILLSP
jgi:formylglycine-generating enzyme required for sulfatase activity